MDDARIEKIWQASAGPASGWEGLSTLVTFRRPPAEAATVPRRSLSSPVFAESGEGFECFEEIGRGGMGVVFRARQTSLDREVAVKTLRASRSGPEQLQQFLGEARLHGRLEHPNILPVHTLGSRDGAPFLAMKLIDGEAWSARLRAQPDALEAHLEILLAVCNAVAYAHNRGVVHADLKPSNVLLGAFGEVQLMDWGVAVELDPLTGQVRNPTSTGFGTPSYMPPELAQGEGLDIGPHTDVYLLGGLLYEILSGRPPRQGTSFLRVLARACLGQIDPLPERAPAALVVICQRALQGRPADRYADVESFQQELREYLTQRESLHVAQTARLRLASTRGVLTELLRAGEHDEERRNRVYRDFAECVAGFGQALELWAANESAARDREQARLAWAGGALRLGDLALCGSLLAELAPAEAPELRARLLQRRLARAGEARNRRRMRVALVALGIVLLLGLSVGLLMADAQNTQIQAERSEATERARIAQGALDDLTEQAQDLLQDWGDQRGREVGLQLLAIALQRWYQLYEAQVGQDPDDWASAATLLRIIELERKLEGPGQGVWQRTGEALAILEDWALRQPEHRLIRGQLAKALILRAELLVVRGAPDEGQQALERALQLCRSARPPLRELELTAIAAQGRAAADRGALREAHACFLQHLQRSRVLIAADTSQAARQRLVVSLRRVAESSRGLGYHAEAQTHIEECLQLLAPSARDGGPLRERIESALARTCLAEVLSARGLLQEAARVRSEVLALWRSLLQRDPANFVWNQQLCLQLTAEAEDRIAQGRTELAAGAFQESIEVWRRLASQDSANVRIRGELYTALSALGQLRLEQGMLERGVLLLSEAAAGLDAMSHQDSPLWRSRRATVEADLGFAHWQSGRLSECLEHYQRALRLREQAPEGDLRQNLRLCNLQLRLASCYQVLGLPREADDLYTASQALSRQLFDRHPHQPEAGRQLATALEVEAAEALRRGDLQRAAKALSAALRLRRQLWDLDHSNLDARCFLADVLTQQAELELARDAPEEAAACLDEAVDHWRQAWERDATQQYILAGRQRARRDRARLLSLQGEPAQALALLEPVIEESIRWLADQPFSLSARRMYCLTLLQTAELLSDLGRLEEAQARLLEAVQQLDHDDSRSVGAANLRCEILQRIGVLQMQLGQPDAACDTLERELQLLAAMTAADPSFRGFGPQRAQAHLALAEALRSRGNDQAALPHSRAAVATARRFLLADSPREQADLAGYLILHADLTEALGEAEESLRVWQEAADLLAAAAEAGYERLREHATALERVAALLGQSERNDKAARCFQQALQLRRELVARGQSSLAELQTALHNAAALSADSLCIALLTERFELGFVRLAQEQAAEQALLAGAEALADALRADDLPAACRVRARALDSLRVRVREQPGDESLRLQYCISLFKQGEGLCALQRPAAAVEVYSELARYGLSWFRVYRLRGLARAEAGDIPGALADLALQQQRQPEPYTTLWRVGLGADPEELEVWLGLETWPGPLVRHLSGQLSWDAAERAALAGQSEDQSLGQLCELYGFAGLWAERAGSTARARELYQACLQTARRDFLEWQWARNRLADGD